MRQSYLSLFWSTLHAVQTWWVRLRLMACQAVCWVRGATRLLLPWLPVLLAFFSWLDRPEELDLDLDWYVCCSTEPIYESLALCSAFLTFLNIPPDWLSFLLLACTSGWGLPRKSWVLLVSSSARLAKSEDLVRSSIFLNISALCHAVSALISLLRI